VFPCSQIGALITAFQNHPDAWTRVDSILDRSTSAETRMVATNILQATVKSKWKILPPDQRNGIKTYVVNLIIKLSSDAKTLAENKRFLTKLNMVLVQIVKQEWPEHWCDTHTNSTNKRGGAGDIWAQRDGRKADCWSASCASDLICAGRISFPSS